MRPLDRWRPPGRPDPITALPTGPSGPADTARHGLFGDMPTLPAVFDGVRPDVVAPKPREWQGQRHRMIHDLRSRGIRSTAVIDAMRQSPRHLFVRAEVREAAYDERALPIGGGQVITVPFIVAFVAEALDVLPEHRVLEIGTGSGYQTAILAALAREVHTVEIVAHLAERARETLAALGCRNVRLHVGDGFHGWPVSAPFDRIVGLPSASDPPDSLGAQLAPGGVLAVPPAEPDGTLRLFQADEGGMRLRAMATILPRRAMPDG